MQPLCPARYATVPFQQTEQDGGSWNDVWRHGFHATTAGMKKQDKEVLFLN
jgi:hypothetical protein